MGNRDGRVESEFDDEIQRNPLAGEQASHEGQDAHQYREHRTRVKYKMYRPPHCSRCGYELTGLQVEGKCPECGQAIWGSDVPPPTSGMAVASMVCGILSIPSCIFIAIPSLILGILAVIFGKVANNQYKKKLRGESTKVFALTGQVCGWIAILISSLYWVFVIGLY